MRAESEGTGTPTWRERLRAQADAPADMVMTGSVSPLYTWGDGAGSATAAPLTAEAPENPGGLAEDPGDGGEPVKSTRCENHALPAAGPAASGRDEEGGG